MGGCDNVLDEYYTWPTELVAVVNMLHMLAYGHQGGAITFLTSILHGPRNLLPLSTTKRYSWAYSWTWRHNVALIRLVGVCGRGVTESTLALRLREEKKDMDGCLHGVLENHKFLMFVFKASKNKIDLLRRQNAHFNT